MNLNLSPLYNIKSDSIRSLVNAVDERTIIKMLERAGVEILDFGGEKVVTCEDLLRVVRKRGGF